MVYMQQCHSQQVLRRYIYVATCKILLLLFCIWISYVSVSDYKVLILKFYTVPVCLHGITNFLNQKAISSKHASFFFTGKRWGPF